MLRIEHSWRCRIAHIVSHSSRLLLQNTPGHPVPLPAATPPSSLTAARPSSLNCSHRCDKPSTQIRSITGRNCSKRKRRSDEEESGRRKIMSSCFFLSGSCLSVQQQWLCKKCSFFSAFECHGHTHTNTQRQTHTGGRRQRPAVSPSAMTRDSHGSEGEPEEGICSRAMRSKRNLGVTCADDDNLFITGVPFFFH